MSAQPIQAPRAGLVRINMGPQHPSTHGVLRLVVDLDGETIVHVDPVIGYLHTGVEKNLEHLTYWKGIPLTDRLDYLSPPHNNHAFVGAVERLLDLEIPPRAQHLRVIWCELSRIASHLFWLATHALDIGALSMSMYNFREREEVLNLFEMASGQRLMTSYIQIGGVMLDVPPGWVERAQKFITSFPKRVDEYEALLTDNPIWKDRTQGIGVFTAEQCLKYGVTGPILRAAGVAHDLRQVAPYAAYDQFDFQVATGSAGDTYDRYRVRIMELRQSARIVQQGLENLPAGNYRTSNLKVVLPERHRIKSEMEALIHHFKLVTEGFKVSPGEAYYAVESPKGEMGCYVVSDGSNKPLRVHFRMPSFAHLQALPDMAKGALIADLIGMIGSIDIVLGEIDR